MMTGRDVLARAAVLLEEGMVFDEFCGVYCPWCAAGHAKTLLDEEQRVEIDVLELIENWDNELPHDAPLVAARRALGPWVCVDRQALTREAAVDILRQAAA
jgi:alkylhydroperoxidase family enzyme